MRVSPLCQTLDSRLLALSYAGTVLSANILFYFVNLVLKQYQVLFLFIKRLVLTLPN